MSDSVVIVGGGIAGQAVCEALRERDPDAAITLVCGETSAPYDRVRLSEILRYMGYYFRYSITLVSERINSKRISKTL